MDITLHDAQDLILKGEVIAVPTETVYGLAASLFKPDAVDKIFALKKRPSNNPLIIHVAQISDIYPFIENPDDDFNLLANYFWPGPLTLVLPIIEAKVPAKVRANLTTAAFRIPNHPVARALLQLTGPLVMPSANLSGRPSSTSSAHVEQDFGINFPVLDGGDCLNGLESTILYKPPSEKLYQIIRQGALTANDFSKVLGYEPKIATSEDNKKPLCPGQLYRHYAPKAKLIATLHFPENFNSVIIGFDERSYPQNATLYSLGSLNDPKSISKNLYHILRKLDENNIQEALIDMNIPNRGILTTVIERLNKAITK